ncbi:M1 family metallopeptidase [Deinococcus maricopensis]|uniref:Aminopeptidase N n=1 Tax=Deinococcus maricopensis (strain DSM 21211 / LMG 22137 / NRRL B-23946 / LB-34) TaxID=709986 RepID=E8U817_DEIML|nr:M1 family metallopeptidase [Deinococcus maricopensis]ADV67206.1 Peptidase M1 membrane alanine aminopeptidase [Deinococcus maricopensis DSM 21211]
MLRAALLALALSAAPTTFDAPRGSGDRLYPKLGDAALDVTHYDLALRTDPGVDHLDGQATLTITARAALQQLNLDLLGPTVRTVTLNGAPASFRHANGKLMIRTPAIIPTGRTFTVRVTYAGPSGVVTDLTSVGGDRIGWLTTTRGSYVLAEPDGARTYYPANDHPADGATYTLHVNAPRAVQVVASGEPAGQDTAGARTTHHFRVTQPIPSYALTVHVNRLDVVTRAGPDGITLRDAYPVGLPAAQRAPFARTSEMLTFLQDLLGPYPHRTYGVAITGERHSALETATLSTFPGGPTSERVAVHELAHQWFGDSLRLGDWSDIWLNEGFATYTELLWDEAHGANTDALVARWVRRARQAPRPLLARTPAELFDATTYDRGALTLHALRRTVGDPPFRRILRAYVERFTGRAVRTDDFLSVVRDVAGESAVTTLRPWIDAREVPALP